MSGKRLRFLPALLLWIAVSVFCFAFAADPVDQFDGVTRIVAIGDVHGDYDRFVELMHKAGLIDQTNRWIGGTTHFVQTGDIPDRWPDSKKVMDLLMELEPQAIIAGGRIHALIGNHEAMNILGDLRYVHDGEIASHGGETAFKDAMRPTGKYGKWICSHGAIIRINDTLFMHGGISPSYSVHSIRKLNEIIREELMRADPEKSLICKDPDGPLWYRGYAGDDELKLANEIKVIQERYGIRHVVVGHTVSKDGVMSRCGGAIVMIDVGLSRAYDGVPACLEIEGGEFRVMTVDGSRRVLIPKNESKQIK